MGVAGAAAGEALPKDMGACHMSGVSVKVGVTLSRETNAPRQGADKGVHDKKAHVIHASARIHVSCLQGDSVYGMTQSFRAPSQLSIFEPFHATI
jgi:hypothetical protein